MRKNITQKLIDLFIAERIKLHITQFDLSVKAGLSLRTIQDFESGRRDSFSEDTLYRMCRALELNYLEVFGDKKIKSKEKIPEQSNIKRKYIIVIILGIFIGLIILISLQNLHIYLRTDWIIPYDDYKWTIKGPGFIPNLTIQQAINSIDYKSKVSPKEVQTITITWSYNYFGTPDVYVSAYAEWEPDKEIRIFNGVVQDSGTILREFQIIAPKKPGIYRIRIFYALAHAPVPSFYGTPIDQITCPGTAPFEELKIEVIPPQNTNILSDILSKIF